MQRILIVNVNWRGDVLFSTPLIHALRQGYPDSYIACLVVPRCAPLLQNNPDLNQIIILDEGNRHKGLLGKIRLIKFLRAERFDIAFLLHRSLTRTLICYLAHIPVRIGYHTKKRSIFLTKKIMALAKPVHKVEYFLNLARVFGIEPDSRDYKLHFSAQDSNFIDNLLRENKIQPGDFLVVLNPGGNWLLKRWPKERFINLANKLIEAYQARIIITGAQKDLRLAQEIAAGIKQPALILCGRTSLGELAALMSRARLVIANDSGPMHIAVSQGAKVVALFGPTDPQITGPYGKGTYAVLRKEVGCRIPCYQHDCQENRCMMAITVEDVLEMVRKII